MEIVTFAWNALKVALGLGFVIFIHELGHFLLAKWNGVKVEKFSIGFGPTLASFRRGVGLRIGTGSRPPGPDDPLTYGETEYIIAALPLGGYVKMLGESTEDQKPDDVAKSTDPRAFHNKSVGGRMAIITAGVIMNLILGFVCFSYVHTQPGVEVPALVGGILPGSPAFEAGLKPGDEIVAVDGERDPSFNQLRSRINLSGAGQELNLRIKRPGQTAEQTLKITPTLENGSPMPAIGFYPAGSLKLAGNPPFNRLPGQGGAKDQPFGGFQVNDAVVAVGPSNGPVVPVTDQVDLIGQFDKLRKEPIVVELDRTAATADGTESKTPERVKIVIEPHRFLDFGFRLTPGPIVAIEPDSPASRAGFKVKDRIKSVGDLADFDPIRLPTLVRDSAGSLLVVTVERPGAKAGETTTETITVTPDATPPWTNMVMPTSRVGPLDVPGLGLALMVEPKIAGVTRDSPASKAGLKAGDTLQSVEITPVKTEHVSGKILPVLADETGIAWPAAFAFLQDNPIKSVKFLINQTEQPIEIQPEVVADWYHPLRGLNFQQAVRPTPPRSLSAAIRLGAAETWDNVTGIYKIFRNLAQRRVGGDAFGGMIPIAQVAYNSASAGFTPFVQFLGFLSVNLAVLNFLPIPPLDGGQFLFLLAEKVRGKPLPESYLAAGTMAGIAFVLILIVVINVKDVVHLVMG